MKTIRNSIVIMLCIVCLLFSVCVIMKFTTTPASASTSNNFTAEDYTLDDRLLKEDGTLSTKNITNFSNEVKSASFGTAFPELSQVIPRQYLETSETNAVFQYNGKEYGFYVVKDGNYFDVLLIDFVYEFEDGKEHSDLEYKIRIKPILQQTFLQQFMK